MNVQDLTPKDVFGYFAEIASIPHGSHNLDRITEYCINFAKNNNLDYRKDAAGNIVIYKPGTLGLESHEPVILQGHLDMVCEKVEDSPINMETDPLELMTDGEWLWAKDTTLGGDDGIALAYCFALLASNDIKHPPLEVLFTANEEVGLMGAHGLDVSMLSGKRLINLDSEEEGIITVSCAGAARITSEIPVSKQKLNPDDSVAFEITVGGLLGGHSGVDINSHRKNAGKVLAELLDWIFNKVRISISNFQCGGRLNVIPNTASMVVACSKDKKAVTQTIINDFVHLMKKECLSTEPGITFNVKEVDVPAEGSSPAGTRQLIFALMECPHGVTEMSPDIDGLVQTSINLGRIDYSNNTLTMSYMARSNADYGKKVLIRKISLLSEQLQGAMTIDTDYSAWEYRLDSPLRDTMVQAYADFYSEVPVISALHAGLECGIIGEKIPNMDMASIGPTIKYVHSPMERMNIASAKRSYDYLLRVLEML